MHYPHSITSCLLLFLAISVSARPLAAQERVAADNRYLKPPAATTVPEGGTTVPMERWGGRPIIAVIINGSGPHRFILDTGSSLTAIIDRKVAATIGIEGGEDLEMARMKGKGVTLETVAVGTTTLSGVAAFVNDIGDFLPGPDAPVGVLGIGLFADCLLTYDFPAGRYRIETGSLPQPGGEIIAYTYVGAIRVEVDVAGTTVPVHLDTGSPSTLLLTNRYDSKLPLVAAPIADGNIRTPMGGARARRATLDGVLRIAGHEYTNPRIRFADLPQTAATGAGNIGAALLDDFALTFDQKNHRLRFAKPKPADD